MKTTAIRHHDAASSGIIRIMSLHKARRSFAVFAGLFLLACSTMRSAAIDTNWVRVVTMTRNLLTTPLTDAQAQALHACNFNQLPPSTRALYLRSVAFSLGTTLRFGNPPSSEALTEYLQLGLLDEGDVSVGLQAHVAMVKEVMQELNVLIAGQVVNVTPFQQAMDRGAKDSFVFFDPDLLLAPHDA